MAERHYGLTRGQNQSWQAAAMSPVPDVDVRINFDNEITRHEAVVALDVIKNAVLEDKWPPVDPSVPSSGSAIEDEAAWRLARQAFLGPLIRALNARNPVVWEARADGAGLQAAADQARTEGRPLKIVGSTPIDVAQVAGSASWRLKPVGNDAWMDVYSENGEVTFVGNAEIRLQRKTRWINLRFKNSNGTNCMYNDVDFSQNHDYAVLGCHFDPGAGTIAIRALLGTGGENLRVTVRFNEFVSGSSSVYSFGINDLNLSDNRSVRGNVTDRHFFRVGGSRWHIARNFISRGRVGVGCMFSHNTGAFDSAPWQQSFIDDIIEGNVFDRVAEEYVGYDVQGNYSQYHNVLTYTTVQLAPGDAATDPVLHVSYNGVGDINKEGPAPWRFVQVMTGPLRGKFAQILSIASVDADTVALTIRGVGVTSGLKSGGGRYGETYYGELVRADYPNLVGQVLAVCDLAIGFKVRNNVFRMYPYTGGTGHTGVSLWGSCVGFEISGNRFIDTTDGELEFNAIRVDCPSGIGGRSTGAGEANWGNSLPNGHNLVFMPSAYGRIFNNDCGGLRLQMRNTSYGPPEAHYWTAPVSYPVDVYNNYNLRGGAVDLWNWRGINDSPVTPTTPVYDPARIVNNA